MVRVYEASGRPVPDARLALGFEARDVWETDLVERGAKRLNGARGRGFSFSLGAFQIKTFEIT